MVGPALTIGTSRANFTTGNRKSKESFGSLLPVNSQAAIRIE